MSSKQFSNFRLKSLILFINDFLKGKIAKNFEESLQTLLDTEAKSSFMLKKKRSREGLCQKKKFIGI